MRRILAPEQFRQWRQAREAGRPAVRPVTTPELDWRPRRAAGAARPPALPGYFLSTLVFPRFDERQWN